MLPFSFVLLRRAVVAIGGLEERVIGTVEEEEEVEGLREDEEEEVVFSASALAAAVAAWQSDDEGCCAWLDAAAAAIRSYCRNTLFNTGPCASMSFSRIVLIIPGWLQKETEASNNRWFSDSETLWLDNT